ncbi:MAG: DNA polymerase I [Rhodobiaceae bacterium]|nr:DNA polymerase I [Rhodobiaceae bacterium]
MSRPDSQDMHKDAPKTGDHVVLVDGSSYIFRAYHALPPLTRKSDGLPVGAVAGFCNMLWKLLRDGSEGLEPPTHIGVIFDHSGKSFRNEFYSDYKAHRPDPPEDLIPQFGLIRDATRAFSVACIEQENFEADDLIATYARIAEEAGAQVTIVASDKDLMQLVGDRVIMFDTMKDKRIGVPEVIEKFGVPPALVADVQGLIGDSTDNIPGVPGIGVKTAAQLMEEYGDLDGVLANAENVKQPKRRQSLIDNAEIARLSRRLATLDREVPLNHPIEELKVVEPDGPKLIAFLKAMEFTTITRRVAEYTGTEAGEVEAQPVDIDNWEAAEPEPVKATQSQRSDGGDPTPADGAAAMADWLSGVPFDLASYETVTTLEQLDAWMAEIAEKGVVAFDTETTGLDAMQADLVGFSLSTEPGRACYVPVAHRAADGFDFGDGGGIEQIKLADALERLKALLEDEATLKILQNAKYDMLLMSRYGVSVKPFDDTMLISYVLDAGRGSHGMDELSKRHLGHTPMSFSDVAGTGRGKLTFDQVPLDRATQYAAEDADVTLRLWLMLKARLSGERVTTVYETLERPLVPVLLAMEREGISIDRAMLARLSGDFAQGMGALESEIEELAGESFNIGSPKQLGDILFGKMGLPGASKTKTGAWTTGASVLEDLAAEGHELPAKVLEWRGLQKLKSTYADALPTYVNPDTGRVHTSFAMASTTTGRLSSSDPNLQNIPVRTEEGRKIRKAFVAAPGHKLLSADYSQIELRVLAHIADIPQLRKAFADGLDIHAMTASEMFSVPIEGMDPMIRRRAKAINFGIIYGISAFGLANQLSIPREEAASYIKRYFERFPGIRDYMDETKKTVRDQLYVTTIFGRKCHYPEVRTGHPSHRAFMERAAINAPIQGSAADIIRRAMVRMMPALKEEKLSARMLLQVHDELIFEVPDDEVDATAEVVRKIMVAAPEPVLKLKVPLQVDARAAANWEEAH